MKISKKLSFLALGLLSVAVNAAAQGMSVSPYSKFGYGLLNDNATSSQRQMGGVGYAMNSGRQINVMNPASYAATDTLTFLFDMGLDFTMLHSSEAASGNNPATSDTQYGGGIEYLTMQVPIGKCMGASLGLVPYSSVGYSFGSKIDNGTNSHEGQGGLNQLYIGFAGRLFKGFSIGTNVSYLFGTTVNDVYVNTSAGSSSLFEQLLRVRDWRVQFGAQYTLNINKEHTLTAGVVYSPGKTLLGKARVIKYDVSADEKPDTLAQRSLKGNASLPDTWGAGLNYGWQGRLHVEADFTYQPWSKVKTISMPQFESTRFADRWQVNLGAEFRPSLRGKYFQRMSYRAGAFFNRDYMMVGDNNVREYGVSFGFGFPALASKTLINLGFEYRHRQAHPNPLLKENYFNIKLGINFNELWFFQNKIK